MKTIQLLLVVVAAAVGTAGAAVLLSYPPGNWDPEMKVLLQESPAWLEPGWQDRLAVAPPPELEQTLREVEVLLALKPERARHAEDIAVEDEYLGTQYYRFFRIESYTHPRTVRLIDAIIDEAAIVVMHFKDRFNRARPWEYSTELQPIIPPPGHPAYPSGHATQAHTVSRVLAKVVPAEAVELEALAQQIARNREIGGVHYASDSAAGRQLADQLAAEFSRSEDFLQMVAAARAEFAD